MDWHTIKIRLATYKAVRLICAVTGEKLADMLHRLVVEEWGRVKDRAEVGAVPRTKGSK